MTYQGSKRRFAKYIVPILQKEIDDNNITTFIDGCCGGCNIIDKIKCENRIAIDIDANLIDLLDKASKGLIEFPEDITRADWDQAKNHPETMEPWRVALISIFASYNTRGFPGGFANGLKDRDTYHERLNTFIAQIPLLKGITFIAADINTIDIKNAVIYVDPPYKNTKTYNYKKFNHEEFWNTVRRLSKDNIVYVSEQTAPDDFETVWSLTTIRNFGGKKTEATENLYKIRKNGII